MEESEIIYNQMYYMINDNIWTESGRCKFDVLPILQAVFFLTYFFIIYMPWCAEA